MPIKSSSENLKGRGQSENTRRRWGDSIGMDLKEVGLEVVGRSHLAQNRVHCRAVVNMVMKFRTPGKAEKILFSELHKDTASSSLHRV
jgi:hypothetical protein